MPELPEVETVRRTLEREVGGKKIASITLYRPKNVTTPQDEFVSLPVGRKIISLGRKGKWLRFHLEGGYVILSHLRMEGKFYYFEQPSKREKHDILYFEFADGSRLVYNDTRKFGRLGLYREEELGFAPSYCELGPEPWDIEPDAYLAKIRRRHGPIKEALLDQTICCGLGNIYADETLFASKLHPLFPCEKVDLPIASALLSNARRILEEALDEGGSTVRSYHPGLGIDGKMQSRLLVYGRDEKPCLVCGHRLWKSEVGGRGSTYCPHCQHRPHSPYVLAITGPIHSGKSTAASYFLEKGFHYFSADEVAKEAYLDETVRKKVIAAFGSRCYRGKKPNIVTLRKKISASNENRMKINAIIHPYVYRQAEKLISSLSEKDCLLLDVPLLLDAKMETLCDDILLVKASLEKRIERLEKLGQDTASLTRINAAYPLQKSEKYATFVVENDGSIEDFEKKLESVYEKLRKD